MPQRWERLAGKSCEHLEQGLAQSRSWAVPSAPLLGTLGGQCTFQAFGNLQPVEEGWVHCRGTQPHQGDPGPSGGPGLPLFLHLKLGGGRRGPDTALQAETHQEQWCPDPTPQCGMTVPGAEGGPSR